jgi:hypothetical protein
MRVSIEFLVSIFNFYPAIPTKKFIFRVLKETSIAKYSLVLHQLIFTCIRYYVGKEWTSTYQYPPIDDSQRLAMPKLYDAIESEGSLQELDNLYHSACFALFAHQKHEYDVSFDLPSKFFSPVICFIVLHCIAESGGMTNSSTITNVVAPIMYSIRASIFRAVLSTVTLERISTFQ